MGKLGPKLQLSFLNSIQICRPKDISSLVINPLPPLTHFSTQTQDILFPSFQDPPPHPSHTTPLPHATTSHHFSPRKQDHNKQQTRLTKEPKLKAKLGNCDEDEEESKKPERQRGSRTRRFKRFGSKEWKDGSTSEVEACMVDRKVNESFIVMKRSLDPCHDFKKSMVEMIVEKQMFEPKELEHLLMSFLSLNSTIHHRAILKAFTQIWKEIFSGSSYN